ncbi:hypothetical protein K2173_013250 [Erythroxylum novogranatense]|uniref:Uncharacterized protein n=1 Tax=Erythroxylum novogranatense TaxID=1862640 RepID=A0AAV8SCB6_9ROSI|nr:hypothetical protein K2173_013250 [Erythroxylum novogranatense]
MSLCNEINQLGDLSSSSPEREAWEVFGRIDALINNAGCENPLDLSEEEWNNVLRTNLTRSSLVSKYVCTRVINAKIGRSVNNISSISSLNRGQLPGGVTYASSKVGLNTMTKVIISFDMILYQFNCFD